MGSAQTKVERVTALALALEGASSVTHGSHVQFLARRKTFAYFLDNHHGDGIVSVCVRVFPGDNHILVKNDPVHFYPPAYLAARGWVAYRLDKGCVAWKEVADLLRTSHLLSTKKTKTPPR